MSRAPEQVQDPLRWCAALALVFWLGCLPYLTAVPHPYFDEVHYLPAARELLVLGEFTNREHPLLGATLPGGARVQFCGPPAARKHWKAVAPQLEPLGLLTPIDQDTFAM